MASPIIKSPWKMIKAELQAELEEYSLVVHRKWTVPDLRSMVVEQRNTRGVTTQKEDPMAGITKMTLPQLLAEGAKLNVLPEGFS